MAFLGTEMAGAKRQGGEMSIEQESIAGEARLNEAM
jgi:hypothetical protein